MIVRSLKHLHTINRSVLGMQTTNIRCFSLSSIQKGLSKYFMSQPAKPPYGHICQVGDPVLRSKAKPVDPKTLQAPEFQNLLEQLRKVMHKYQIVGISASQIGVPLQVFAVEVTEAHIKNADPLIKIYYEMEPIPLMYFINPTMKVTNPEEVSLIESCGSVIGYQAEVARAKEVEINALNRLGESFCWTAEGWKARIIQHEFDHINGTLFIDKMNPSTFEFCFWEELNQRKGKVQLRYSQ